jgi:hypothetical protein
LVTIFPWREDDTSARIAAAGAWPRRNSHPARLSEAARKRAKVKAAVASAAVVNTTMIRAADAAESPKLTAL